MRPRFLPVGEAAMSVELGSALDPVLNAGVQALDRALARDPFPGLRETVPTYRSLLLIFDPERIGGDEIKAWIGRILPDHPGEPKDVATHVVPTVYGGDAGPDLAEVASRTGLPESEVIARHGSQGYTAFMLGFLPGFAYLGLLDPALETPRRSTPRSRVPAGSVAIAGRQTGIYPSASPGGWNIIGRTSLRLFDSEHDPPCLVLPGDRVRFIPVAASSAEAVPSPARLSESFDRQASPVIEVVKPGLLTTVQDAGRIGHRRYGIAWAGALDAVARRSANRAVENPDDAAVLECTAVGPTLRFHQTTRFAVSGADLGAVLHRADLGVWPVPMEASVLARPGNLLTFAGRRTGCRAYLALAGGIDVPSVLNARATDLTAGFGGAGGRALRAGDWIGSLPVRGQERASAPSERRRVGEAESSVGVRVILGPQDDHFDQDAIAVLLGETFTVDSTSDRVGCRLSGPLIAHRGPAEIVTDGMLPGCIQVPPDGRPIVMLADGPTTGGYPKIATVISADLPLLAQLLPGEGRVRFRLCDGDRNDHAAGVWRE